MTYSSIIARQWEGILEGTWALQQTKFESYNK